MRRIPDWEKEPIHVGLATAKAEPVQAHLPTIGSWAAQTAGPRGPRSPGCTRHRLQMTLQWSSNVGAPHTSHGSPWKGEGCGGALVTVSAIQDSKGRGGT